MSKEHALGFGAIAGFVFGAVVFAVGMVSTPDMVTHKVVTALVTPLVPIVDWLQGPSHSWGPGNSGIYKLLVLLACYWILIGAVIGFGGWLLFGERSVNRPAGEGN
jgi:hypothetical protein